MKEAEPIWLEKLEEALAELKVVPHWGQIPSFPWESLADRLKSEFELKSLTISPKKSHNLKREELLSGLGKDPYILSIDLSPLTGHSFWAISREAIGQIATLLSSTEMRSSALSEGFYLFLILKIAQFINEEKPLGDIQVQLSDHGHLPEEGALCIDVEILIEKHPFWARLILPSALQTKLKDHFAGEKLKIDNIDPSLSLPLHIEIGQTTLEKREWKSIAVGDLLLLDRCSFDPDQQKGTATLTLANIPLFQLRLKEGEIKILDYAFLQEQSHLPHENEENGTSNDRHLWASHREETHGTPSAENPLTLTVEAGKISLPLEKVVDLKSDHLFESNWGSLPTVHLTVKGRSVAQGELIRLGDRLGVKIIKLA